MKNVLSALLVSALLATWQYDQKAGRVALPSSGVQIYTATATLDFPATLTTDCDDLTVSVTGAQDTNACFVGPASSGVPAEGQFTCWVSVPDVVTIRHCSHGVIANPASASFRVVVVKF